VTLTIHQQNLFGEGTPLLSDLNNVINGGGGGVPTVGQMAELNQDGQVELNEDGSAALE
jgi:hypothetical protein